MNSDAFYEARYLEATHDTWHAEHSPWKAAQILKILRRNGVQPKTVGEIGCGAGQILAELGKELKRTQFYGYDISPHAIELCQKITMPNCHFACEDLLQKDRVFDLLLVIDVYEHIPDYVGFVEQCRKKADLKIYHIPLDISVQSVLRNSLIPTGGVFPGGRYHLHYFTADWALATLRETGHDIVDYSYTCGSMGLFRKSPRLRTALANIPRWVVSKFSVPLSARLFGGYSLLVLAK